MTKEVVTQENAVIEVPTQQAPQDNMLMAIIEKAVTNPEVDVDKMSAMLDVQERIMNKNAEAEFNIAMVSALGEIPSFEEKTQGHGYKYATFEQINKIVKPILAKYDLFVNFTTNFKDKGVYVTAQITHKGGHAKQTTGLFPFDPSGSKNNIQAVGSAISYGKRYMQNALLNITTHGEDDDGFATEKTISTAEIAKINAGILKSGIKLSDFLEAMNVSTLSEIKMDNYAEAIGFLTNLIDTQKDKKNDSK